MKRLLIPIILFGICTANVEMDVYTLMLKTNNLTIQDIKEIHSKTIIGSGNGNYIEYQETPFQLIKIVINRKNDNEVRYTLLHEIGHYVDKKYKKQIPLTATNKYSKVSQDELYAESFSQLYY